MGTKIKALLQSIPGFRYLSGVFIQKPWGKQHATLFAFGRRFNDDPAWHVTRLDNQKSLFMDRLTEVARYYRVSPLRLVMHYLRNGTPNTDYYRYRLHTTFTSEMRNPDRLKDAYRQVDFMYAQRLMLRYHQYRLGKEAADLWKRHGSSPLSSMRVLDYGCGVADPSLFLALFGAAVTLVDLDTRKFAFARERFVRRGLPVVSLPVTQTEHPCDLSSDARFDVIIMSEFLEHVRSPRRFLEWALIHLEEGGILYDSLGPVYRHRVGGDHLPEAKEEIESTDYTSFHQTRLIPASSLYPEVTSPHFYLKQS